MRPALLIAAVMSAALVEIARFDTPSAGRSLQRSRSASHAVRVVVAPQVEIVAALDLPKPREVAPPRERSRGEDEGQPAFLTDTSEEQRRAWELICEASYNVQEKDPERACALFREAIRLDPDDVAVSGQAHRGDMRFGTYRELARLELKLGRPDQALSTYGVLLSRLPYPDGEIWAGIAKAWEAKGDRARALEFYWTAAQQGYGYCVDDPRRFLHEAVRRLVPEEARRAELLEREIREFDDWIAWRYRAEILRSCGDDPPTRELVAGLESSVAARRQALEALLRSDAISGRRDEALHERLEKELADDEKWLREERENLRRESEGR